MDLIAGLAGQTFASWEESLEVLIDSGVPHASVYMLEVDEDSRLGREMLTGGARYHAELVPTDDAIARMYETGNRAAGRRRAGAVRDFELLPTRLRFAAQSALLAAAALSGAGAGCLVDAAATSAERIAGTGYVLRSTTTDDLKAYLDGPEPVGDGVALA